MSDIFISYASQDRPVAQRLASALADEGWSVWWDRTIMPGKSFARMIEDALDDTQSVVVLWSEVSRDRDWVQNEARHGHERCVLIPVLIEDVKPPFEFRHIHAASLMGWDGDLSHLGYRQLLAAISELCGLPPQRKEDATRHTEEAAAKRKAEEEEQAKRAAEVETARRKAEREAQQKPEQDKAESKRKLEKEAGQTDQGPVVAKAPTPKPTKAPWIATGAVLLLLAIGFALVQPWTSSNSVPKLDERSATKLETKTDVAAIGTANAFEPGETFRDCEVCPEMVVVPAGSFLMGSPFDEPERDDDEGPQHRVTIAKPFAVGVYEVTFSEWDACVEDGGCYGYHLEDEEWGRERRPVISVSWEDARAYTKWLSNKTSEDYQLLTEAEWEYVARAGTTTPFHFGSTITTDQASYDGIYTYNGGAEGEYRGKTVPVGSFPANRFGLYDVHGNIGEWVADCYDKHAYQTHKGYPEMAGSWQESCLRVLRGGSWDSAPGVLRSASRSGDAAYLRNRLVGFRVARTL